MLFQDKSLNVVSHDREWDPKYLDIVASLYICTLFLTWVTAGKMFAAGGLILSASALVYPLNSIFGDILTEVYGFNRTRRLIWMGLLCGVLFLIATQVAIALPPAPGYAGQEAFALVNGAMPRIVLGSYLAYVCCEFVNSFIMSKMKLRQGAKGFSGRALLSTAVAQLVDSIVFFTIAFAGVMAIVDLGGVIVSSWIVKTSYEALVLPATAAFVRFIKQKEGVEQFDRYELKVFRF